MKLLLKACLRCGGDLFPDNMEPDGASFVCLQCGCHPFRRPPPAEAGRDITVAREPRRRAHYANRTSRTAV